MWVIDWNETAKANGGKLTQAMMDQGTYDVVLRRTETGELRPPISAFDVQDVLRTLNAPEAREE